VLSLYSNGMWSGLASDAKEVGFHGREALRASVTSTRALTASFRPAEQVVVLRSYLRQRQMLIRYAGQHVQHMQKALEQMNVKLTEVVSDVTGVTGMAIIQAILRGERNPLELAKLRNEKCKRTEAEICAGVIRQLARGASVRTAAGGGRACVLPAATAGVR
jgi:hypothetical protein